MSCHRCMDRRASTTAEILVCIGLAGVLFFVVGQDLLQGWRVFATYAAGVLSQGLP